MAQRSAGSDINAILSCVYVKINQQSIYLTVFHDSAFPDYQKAITKSSIQPWFRKLFASDLCFDLRKPFPFTSFEVISEILLNSVTRCSVKRRHSASLTVRGSFSPKFLHISTCTTRGSAEFTFLKLCQTRGRDKLFDVVINCDQSQARSSQWFYTARQS